MQRRGLLKLCAASTALFSLGAWYWPRRWKYIVVHHSAGNFGNIEFLQAVHRERQEKDPLDAIPYHFVIGNGNGLKLGEVVSDWRQENNLWGMHVSGRNSDRNFRGLGICMIGNFEVDVVPQVQFQALVTLIKKLRIQFNIELENITGHGHIDGEMTLCPGKNFPMKKLMAEIAKV